MRRVGQLFCPLLPGPGLRYKVGFAADQIPYILWVRAVIGLEMFGHESVNFF